MKDVIFSSKESADYVLETMKRLIQQDGWVSVGDFKRLSGYPLHVVNFEDDRLGWNNLSKASVKETKDGWYIDIPTL